MFQAFFLFLLTKKTKKNGPCPAVRKKKDKKTVSEKPEKCGPEKNEKKNGFSIFDTKAIVARARSTVKERLGFTCSAGIAANKLLAKLCGGLHKPNQQTVLPPEEAVYLLDCLKKNVKERFF